MQLLRVAAGAAGRTHARAIAGALVDGEQAGRRVRRVGPAVSLVRRSTDHAPRRSGDEITLVSWSIYERCDAACVRADQPLPPQAGAPNASVSLRATLAVPLSPFRGEGSLCCDCDARSFLAVVLSPSSLVYAGVCVATRWLQLP